MCGDDFATKRGGAAEIGAEQRAPAIARGAIAQRKANMVTDETHEAFAGLGRHGWNRPFHLDVFSMKMGRHKPQKCFYGVWEGISFGLILK